MRYCAETKQLKKLVTQKLKFSPLVSAWTLKYRNCPLDLRRSFRGTQGYFSHLRAKGFFLFDNSMSTSSVILPLYPHHYLLLCLPGPENILVPLLLCIKSPANMCHNLHNITDEDSKLFVPLTDSNCNATHHFCGNR